MGVFVSRRKGLLPAGGSGIGDVEQMISFEQDGYIVLLASPRNGLTQHPKPYVGCFPPERGLYKGS